MTACNTRQVHAALLVAALACAAGLIQNGVRPGDRVGLLSENRVEWVLADMAIRRISRGVAHSSVDIWDQQGRLVAMGGQSHVVRSMVPAGKGD